MSKNLSPHEAEALYRTILGIPNALVIIAMEENPITDEMLAKDRSKWVRNFLRGCYVNVSVTTPSYANANITYINVPYWEMSADVNVRLGNMRQEAVRHLYDVLTTNVPQLATLRDDYWGEAYDVRLSVH